MHCFVNKNTIAVHMPVAMFVEIQQPGFVHLADHHLTVMDRSDVAKLKLTRCMSNREIELWIADLAVITDIPSEPTRVGLGRIDDGANAVYFDVYDWPEMQAWRAAFGLPPKDAHVTLAVRGADIHGRAKDRSTLVKQ